MEMDDFLDPNDRKRRRGIIEKRRRDRINNCLTELKRLVPLAAEKDSSTKLEKAEILQLTVDYLKSLQKYGNDSSQSKSTDEKSAGFHDCMIEMSRYLVNIEGFSLNDPLRLRLLSHLHTHAQDKISNINQQYLNDNSTTTTTNTHFDQLSSSSSNSSSPHKFDTKSPAKQFHNQQTQANNLLSTQTQFLNNSAFVQINITANNTKTNNFDSINEANLWNTSNFAPNTSTCASSSYSYNNCNNNDEFQKNFISIKDNQSYGNLKYLNESYRYQHIGVQHN